MATALIYYFQLRAIRKANELKSILTVIRYVENVHLRRARWFVYLNYKDIFKELPDAPLEVGWPEINRRIKRISKEEFDLHDIDLVLNTLNDIAYLININHVPEDLALSFLQHTFQRCWHFYKPYIEWRQKPDHRLKYPGGDNDPSKYARQLELLIAKLDDPKKSPNRTLPTRILRVMRQLNN